MIVGASGITVDLKGFTIRGDRGLGDYGIDDSGGFDSVTIKNGVLRNFNECIMAATNVTIADKLTVQNMVVSANASRGIIVRGNSAKIQSTIASGNGEGILVIGDLASIKSVTAHGHTGGTGVKGRRQLGVDPVDDRRRKRRRRHRPGLLGIDQVRDRFGK